MPPVEVRHTWTLLSTGAGARLQLNGGPRESRWYLETSGSSRSTASVRLMTARSTNSSTPGVELSSHVISSNAVASTAFTGPFLAVWPHVAALGSTGAAGSTGTVVTVELIAI